MKSHFNAFRSIALPKREFLLCELKNKTCVALVGKHVAVLGPLELVLSRCWKHDIEPYLIPLLEINVNYEQKIHTTMHPTTMFGQLNIESVALQCAMVVEKLHTFEWLP